VARGVVAMSAPVQLGDEKRIAVSFSTRDLILYALGIGASDLRFVYENDADFAAFPTFPIVLPFKGTATDVVGFPSDAMMQSSVVPPLDGTQFVLDGERYLELIRPFPTEPCELTLRSKCIGVHRKGKGALVETESFLERNGETVVRIVSGAFLVGAKGFADTGRSFSKAIDAPARKPDFVDESSTLPGQAHIYRLSGDYNPLHVDPTIAQMNGFSEPILHGLCTLGFATRAVLKYCADNDPARFRSVRLRFAKPVLPGQTLVTSMWREGNTVIFVVTEKSSGTIVVNNACVELKAAAKL